MNTIAKLSSRNSSRFAIGYFQTNQLRKYLFDKNPDENLLRDPRLEHFFSRIKEITQESWLHQLAKLHDPAAQGGNINLSVDYLIEFGDWDAKCLAGCCFSLR